MNITESIFVDREGKIVSFADTADLRATLQTRLIKWFAIHGTSGEAIAGSERAQDTAAEFLGDIADTVFNFKRT